MSAACANSRIEALAAAIARLPGFTDVAAADLVPLRRKGVSHEHYVIPGRGLVARVPRLSQWDLDRPSFLAYQEAAFARTAASGHTPKLHAVIPVGPTFASGALIVDRISGDAPTLPGAMPTIADALAAIHTLSVPPPHARPPLDQTDPIAATLARIEDQARHLPQASLSSEARAQIAEELTWARQFAADRPPRDPPPSLVGTDTHPGNFLIDRHGGAWFVDLEKAAYGNPAIDLAHASLPTSTGWDPDCRGALSDSDIFAFYACYGGTVGLPRWAALQPWLMPARRLTWLRTITWFARWRVDFARSPAAPDDPTVRAHIEHHIDRCLDPATIERVRQQWQGPDRLDLG